MIIPNWIFAAFALAGGTIAYILLSIPGTIKNVGRWALIAGLLVGALADYLILLPARCYIIVEEKEDAPGTYTHKTINAYGRPELPLSDGSTIPTDSLDLPKGRKPNLFNCTGTGMLVYATAYTSGKEKDIDLPDPVYVESGCYDQIPNAPHFWFTDAPDTITERENIFKSIANSISGSANIKWTIIPYDLDDEELDEDEEDVDEDKEEDNDEDDD
jgi:hypothetical protein